VLRRERSARQIMNYLYVLDGEGRLVGVVSLRDLVLAEPSSEVAGLMEDDVVAVTVETDEREAGRLMIKYDLLALPVVDAQRRPLGIVTIDDALDAVLPADWKQRLPRLFR